MKLTAARVVDLAVIAFFGIFVFEARGWRLEARLYPWVVGISMLGLAVVHLIQGLRRGDGPSRAPGSAWVDTGRAPGTENEHAPRQALGVFAWSAGLLAAIWLVGFALGVPLFVFLYLKVEAREGWRVALVLAGVAGLGFWGLFDQFLHLPFPDGRLLSWLDVR